jgi:predicted RNase H-like HicB family nuclease
LLVGLIQLGTYNSTMNRISPSERAFTVVIHPGEADEGGYWAEVPALPGCHSEGDTYAETLANVREAIECYIEALQQLGKPIPDEPQPHQVTRQAVKVAV